MSSGANPWAPLLPGWGGRWSGCVHAAPPGQGSEFDYPLSRALSTPSPFLPLFGVQRNYLYICINVYLVTVSLPPVPIPRLHGHSPAPSTLYIMYRKSLCMVEGGRGGFRELGEPLPPKPPIQAKIFAKGHPSPGHSAMGGRGKTHLVNYF